MIKTILISGFGVFGNYRSNLSETVAKTLDHHSLGNFRFVSVLFVAEASKRNLGEMIFNQARVYGASAVISLGIASEKKGICVETKARNLFLNEKYCPELMGKPINPNRNIAEELELDLAPWNINQFCDRCSSAVLSVEVSRTCSGFCCNQLAYQARAYQLEAFSNQTIPFIFLHIPCAREDVPDIMEFTSQGKIVMTEDEVVAGLSILLDGSNL